jgi:signal transduction histidine kinase
MYPGDADEFRAARRASLVALLRSRTLWQQRQLHPAARILLVLVAAVLLCVGAGFVLANESLAPDDLLAAAFYLGLAAFAWYPTAAAFAVMLICSIGVVFTGSGGDLLELTIALGMVAATCVPWVIATHVVVLGVLTAYISATGTSLTAAGVYAVAGIAVIAFLAGVTFRLIAAREAALVAERSRVVSDLQTIARDERERIADELHDGIAHDLTLVLFHARALPKQPDEEARLVSLSTIEESAERALNSIASLLSLLAMMRGSMPDDSAPQPTRYSGDLVEVARSLGSLLSNAGISTTVTTPDRGPRLPPACEGALSEAALEAVTNIIKHAPASHVASIEIRETTRAVELFITNVVAVPSSARASAAGGRGLKRSAERLTMLHGALDYGWDDQRWTVRASVPSVTHEEH